MEARKYSKKREAILEALKNTKEHPTARKCCMLEN